MYNYSKLSSHTMSIRRASDPIPDNVPLGIDVTQPKDLVLKVERDVALFISCRNTTQRAHLARREAQDNLYRIQLEILSHGTSTFWSATIHTMIVSTLKHSGITCAAISQQNKSLSGSLTCIVLIVTLSQPINRKRGRSTLHVCICWKHLVSDGYDPDTTTDPCEGRYDFDDTMEI